MFNGEVKVMVVIFSRFEVVCYKIVFEKYVCDKGYEGINVMVVFFGEVNDFDIFDFVFIENSMNLGLKGWDMCKVFDMLDY